MTDTKIDFTDVQWTQLVTLWLRGLDAGSPTPILGDREAAAVLDRVSFDVGPWMRSAAGDRYMVVLRARTLDGWAAEYLTAHPGATVVQLGCGLDSRAFRLQRPAGTRWFDVDLPDVIALRRRLYTDDEHYRMIACSVTDPAWLDGIPADGPVLVIAEGLLMYLAPADVATLLRRVSAAFGTGELVFDAMAPWVVRVSGLLPGRGRAYRQQWALGDAGDLERMDPSFRVLDQVRVLGLSSWIPETGMRLLYRALAAVPGLRDTMRMVRCSFGTRSVGG